MKKSEYLLSVSEVKKLLKEKSREELIEFYVDSYKNNKELKEYIAIKYASKDTKKKILIMYKEKIRNVFFPNSMRREFKIIEAKKIVDDFKKMCSDERTIVDLMLYYVEMGVEFTNRYGDINESFYNNVQLMYRSVANYIDKQENRDLFDVFEFRLRAVLDNTSDVGWGLYEEIRDIYYEINWTQT